MYHIAWNKKEDILFLNYERPEDLKSDGMRMVNRFISRMQACRYVDRHPTRKLYIIYDYKGMRKFAVMEKK